jgi:pimeloyl-ACP methyl ester carboxylesterase
MTRRRSHLPREPGEAAVGPTRTRGFRCRCLSRLVSVPGGHHAPFLDQPETVIDAELTFIQKHLTGNDRRTASAA